MEKDLYLFKFLFKFIENSENIRHKLNNTPFLSRTNAQQNEENEGSQEKILKKLRRQSKSQNKESNNCKNENLQQKISNLQEEFVEKFGNNQKLNIFPQDEIQIQFPSKNGDSLQNVRRSLNFENIEDSHEDDSKIDKINKNSLEEKKEKIINENGIQHNENMNFKKLYESVFCVKCLDKRYNLLDFHKEFMNLLNKFDFFKENCKKKELIIVYLQKILNESSDEHPLTNSSKILDNIKVIDENSKTFNNDENLLDKSLKEKLNRMSDVLNVKEFNKFKKSDEENKEIQGIENVDPEEIHKS